MKDVHELQSRRLNFIFELLLEKTKEFADINRDQPLEWSIMHMYSCSQLAKLLAMKRGLDLEGTVVQYGLEKNLSKILNQLR
ncbi:MAG: hypothetical protein H7647_09720 [Candidatus Heimdallarchaeota archaeon]|nr:hypothetical protein [Candidatus Heimdallarchaeota archaeon]